MKKHETLKKEFESELEDLRSKGLARSISLKDDSRLINFSSNDYLGLTQHPAVVKAAAEAVMRFGTGGASSRLLAGTISIHQELEKALAEFLGQEAALVFSSGYHANTGILPVLVGPSDIVFFDRLCHASLIDGVRLSKAPFSAFKHNDASDLERRLKKQRPGRGRAVIVTEGAFSMDGDLPPLKEIAALAKKWDALVYIDEAHSLGVMGPGGRGFAAREGLSDGIDIFVGTLSKSLASQGGFVAASRSLIDLLVSRCRSFIYTTALAPASAAAAREALRLLPEVEDRRARIQERAAALRKNLGRLGFSTLNSDSPIIPVWTGSLDATRKLSGHLLSGGFFVPSIRPPTVPMGEGRVRLSMSYGAAADGVEPLLAAFADYAERPSPERPQKTGEKIVQAR